MRAVVAELTPVYKKLLCLAILFAATSCLAAADNSPVPEPQVEVSFYGIPKPQVRYSVDELCSEIGHKLGSVSERSCLAQHLLDSGRYSVLGRPLANEIYPPLAARQPLGRILLIGGIHGDEYASISVVFKWMEILDQYHSGLFHWKFIPLSNPDGLLRDHSQRQNANGVDLNRNFPSADWNDLALDYWRERTNSNDRRYPGPTPSSEPEVVSLVEEIRNFQPDIIVSVHAPFHLVDYDGPPSAPEKIGELTLRKLGVYPGSLGNFGGLDLNIPVVTIELPYAGIMPTPEHISAMWTDLVSWLIKELG
jgi:murein peptide amidase A